MRTSLVICGFTVSVDIFKKLQYFSSSTNSSPECFVICVLCFRGAGVSLRFEVGGLVVE